MVRGTCRLPFQRCRSRSRSNFTVDRDTRTQGTGPGSCTTENLREDTKSNYFQQREEWKNYAQPQPTFTIWVNTQASIDWLPDPLIQQGIFTI